MVATRRHPLTGTLLKRDVRPFVVEYQGRKRTVDLPGWYPAKGNNGVLVGDDMAVTDKALAELKAEVQNALTAPEVEAVRRRGRGLKSTAEAAE